MNTLLDNLFEDVPPVGEKRIALVIGRFSPPTKGHYELINNAKSFIKGNLDLNLEANPVVIVIGNDKKEKTEEELAKNPLSVTERIDFMRASGLANGVIFMHAKNAFEALMGLRKNNMEPIAIAAGTDRIDDYLKILDKYFKDDSGKAIKHLPIHLKRDERAIDKDKEVKSDAVDDLLNAMQNGDDPKIDEISGSLARRAAELGYEEEFNTIVGLEKNKKLAAMMYKKVRAVVANKTQKENK